MPAVTIRQGKVTPFQDTNTGTASNTWVVNLENNTLAGNALILLAQANSGVTFNSVTDNQSNANWAQVITDTLGQSIHGWMCTNVAAGTNQITITFNQVDGFNQFCVMEVAGLTTVAVASAIDGTAQSATGISTTSIATAALGNASGSFVVQLAADSGNTGGMAFTAGSGFTMFGAELVAGFGIQARVASGNTTPTITRAAGTATFNTIGFAVKADATKGDATQNTAGNCFVRFTQTSFANVGKGPGFNLQFPSAGDCLVCAVWQGDNTKSVSSISDSLNSSWPAARTTSNVTNGQVEIWSPGHCSTGSTMTATVTFSSTISTAATGEICLIDILGSASSAIGALGTNKSGTQSVTGNLTTNSITPTGTGSAIINATVINSHCLTTLTGGTKWTTTSCYSPDFDGSDQGYYDCDGIGIYMNGTDQSAQSFIYAVQHNTAGVGTWGAVALEILAAAGTANNQIWLVKG